MNKSAMRICKLSMFLLSFVTNLLAPFLIMIRRDFQIGLRDSGFLLFSFYAGNFFACLICGRLNSILGKRKTLCISLTLMALFALCTSAAPSFFLLCLLLFGIGISTLLAQVTSNAIPAELEKDKAASSLASIVAYSGLGACGGLIFSGIMSFFQISWRFSYLSFGVVCALCALFAWRAPFAELPRSDSGQLPVLVSILKTKKFQPSFLLLLLYSGSESAVCSWLVTYLAADQDFSTLSGSMVTAVIWLFSFIGRIICSRLVDRLGKRRILFCLMPFSAITICLFPLLHGFQFWIGAALLGLFMSGIWPLVGSAVLDQKDHDSSAALSVAYLFSFLGNSLIPYLIGAIAEGISMPFGIFIDGLFFLLLFFLYLLAGWKSTERKMPT
ncbi:MAG: MFS transporter [Ruminococcus sp.]|jgi:FHS family L-fucose permease-like MFS transporter